MNHSAQPSDCWKIDPCWRGFAIRAPATYFSRWSPNTIFIVQPEIMEGGRGLIEIVLLDQRTRCKRALSDYGIQGGTHYRSMAEIILQKNLVDIYIEIPFHATGKNIDSFGYQNYFNIDQTKYIINWGDAGIMISVPAHASKAIDSVLGL